MGMRGRLRQVGCDLLGVLEQGAADEDGVVGRELFEGLARDVGNALLGAGEHLGSQGACQAGGDQALHVVFAGGVDHRVHVALFGLRHLGRGAELRVAVDGVALHAGSVHVGVLEGVHDHLLRLGAAGAAADQLVDAADVFGGADHAGVALLDPDGLIA